MIGIDVSFANALRRIMISEVATMAIEIIYIYQNTSITHDEVLSHRIGLIPLMVDPRGFEQFQADGGEEGTATDYNTLVFNLQVNCQPNGGDASKSSEDAATTAGADAAADRSVADELAAKYKTRAATNLPNRPYTRHVYSSDLKWVPCGDQSTRFAANPPRAVDEDILITKLRPGQEINLECHARKSVGKDHAKYSPVATASYRMKPVITLLEPVYDEDADELAVVEPGVFTIVPCNRDGHTREAKLVNEYACTMSRNYMRNETLKRAVKMERDPGHFIFSIESVGMLSALEILCEALDVLKGKCEKLAGNVDNYGNDAGEGSAADAGEEDDMED
jgi:DNA-directed RNA polymerase I and III subunit RPAC1